MTMQDAQPSDLKDLYQVMYGYRGLGFDQPTAQHAAIGGAVAGADAASFKDAYTQAIGRHISPRVASQQAAQAAVKANLGGIVRRYAKDAKPYTAEEFSQY